MEGTAGQGDGTEANGYTKHLREVEFQDSHTDCSGQLRQEKDPIHRYLRFMEHIQWLTEPSPRAGPVTYRLKKPNHKCLDNGP